MPRNNKKRKFSRNWTRTTKRSRNMPRRRTIRRIEDMRMKSPRTKSKRKFLKPNQRINNLQRLNLMN